MKETTVGSDYYPILIEVELGVEKQDIRGVKKWCFSDANWDTFGLISDQEMQRIDMNVEVDDL